MALLIGKLGGQSDLHEEEEDRSLCFHGGETRALGDITDRHRNLVRNVVKVDRGIIRISEVESIKNMLAHGEAKKENLVIQRCGKRGLETEENEPYIPRTKAVSMNDEETPRKETKSSDCDSSYDSYMFIETADSGSETEKSSLHEYDEIEMEEVNPHYSTLTNWMLEIHWLL